MAWHTCTGSRIQRGSSPRQGPWPPGPLAYAADELESLATQRVTTFLSRYGPEDMERSRWRACRGGGGWRLFAFLPWEHRARHHNDFSQRAYGPAADPAGLSRLRELAPPE